MPVCVYIEALRDMQAVAEHMNEMQKIYDEYGAVFDALSSDAAPHCRVSHPAYSLSVLFYTNTHL